MARPNRGPRERVVVIGGGVTGALVSARLAERGLAVTLLEKAAIGNGSSSRSMAGIRAQFGVPESVLAMLFSEWWYSHFHDLLATPSTERQPVIRQNGYLFLYEHPDAPDAPGHAEAHWTRAQANVAMQRELGAAVELLSPDEVGTRWPHLVVDRMIGATWCPTDGFLFPPVIYGEGVRRAAELGAHIGQHTEVIGARHRAGRITGLETSRGVIEADWVINCTNAWAARVSARIGGMPLPISPVKRFLYHFDPRNGALPESIWRQLPMTIYGMGRPLGAHSRPEGSHLVLAGMSDTPVEPEFEDADQDRVPAAFDHRHGIENLGFRILADLALYAPELVESGGLFATTCGYYGMSPDAVPLIGYDGAIENLIHAVGFSGHGVMHAPVSAVLVEELVCGERGKRTAELPPPFEQHHLDLGVFDPRRDFAQSRPESAVL